MTATSPAPVRATLVTDFELALLVSAVVLVGSGVTLEDDWQISLGGDYVGPWLPGALGLR